MKKHMSHGSPSSKAGTMIGAGYKAGAGEMPHIGPGKAASRYGGMTMDENMSKEAASSATPKGMHVYKEGGGR